MELLMVRKGGPLEIEVSRNTHITQKPKTP